MRCLELFAGAGGAALGLERAGIHHAALVEWDASACATLRAAGLGPVVEGDVGDLDAIEAVAGRDVDLIWSSFPCQAWSAAGKRLGAMDPRNGWPATVAALDHFGPRWFLGENVTGLLCHRGGCTYRGGQEGLFAAADPNACPGCYFERVILPDLRARFACSGFWVIDAADHGTPQHRRRVILWAGPVEPERPRETHGPGRPMPWVSMGEALGLSAIICGQPPIRVEHMPSPTVTCHWSKDGEKSQQAVRVTDSGDPYLSQPSPTVSAVSERERPPWTSAGQPWLMWPAGTTSTTAGQPTPTTEPSPAISTKGNQYLTRPSPTVSAAGECKGSGPGGSPEKMQRASDALYLGTGRRRLTYQECATLQGFPVDHPWQGTITERYRQVGNAVIPFVAELVGRAIIEADKVNP